MSEPDTELDPQVPDADAAEQSEYTETLPTDLPLEADEADVTEQEREAGPDDDDYR